MTITLKPKKFVLTETEKALSVIDKDKLVRQEAAKTFAPIQKRLGLGAPRGSQAKSPLSTPIAQTKKLAEKFRCVQKPTSSDNFINFDSHQWGSNPVLFKSVTIKKMSDIKTWNKPKLAMAKLTDKIENVQMNVTFKWKNPAFKKGDSASYRNPEFRQRACNYRASVPVMPQSVLEKAMEAKMLCPSGEFYLIWETAWALVPQRDPILLMKASGEYFEIAAWDGDQDLIKEYLLYKDEISK